jgi:hypothetical protein
MTVRQLPSASLCQGLSPCPINGRETVQTSRVPTVQPIRFQLYLCRITAHYSHALYRTPGPVTSDSVSLVTPVAPAITTHPASQTVINGEQRRSALKQRALRRFHTSGRGTGRYLRSKHQYILMRQFFRQRCKLLLLSPIAPDLYIVMQRS